ncbi:MAG: response regulator [Microgenomates group bacterium]|jgi:DNA-binding response OmpR family regulator
MKILIIEHNDTIAQKYKDALTQIGFAVIHAKSAVAGLKILNEDIFSLILLNIMLPDMHGLNLIKNLHKNNPGFNTPLVILTENAEDNLIQESYNLNVRGYLIHAIHTPEQVADCVKAALYINK